MTASRSRNRLADVSATAQCARLLERLKVGSINSFEIVSELNICRPGARIADLRASGPIRTHLSDLVDEHGFKHPRVATYYLTAAEESAA
jgi:hypothetical protein